MTFFLRRNYRWLVVALLFLLSTVNYLDRQTLSVLAPTLRDLHGLTSEHYSYVVTGFLVAYMAGYAIVGPLLDRYGVKSVITVAVAVWSVAAILHSIASGWIGLLICRVLLGLGESAAPIGGAKAVGEWIPARERGLAMGIFSTGNIVGAIVAAPLVTIVLLKASWQAAFIATGAMATLWLFAWMYLYHAPECEPQLSDVERALILGDRPRRVEKKISAWVVLRYRYGYGLFIARLLTDTVPFFFSFWLPEYLHRSRDISISMIGVVAWIPYLAADLGGLSGGGFSDFLVRRGRRPQSARFTLLLIAACVTPLACMVVRTRSIVIALGCISCVLAAHSAWIVNLLTLITESAPVGHAGATLGISSVGGALGGVIMSLAAGRIIPAVGYTPVFTVLGFMHLCGFAVLWLALRRNGHMGNGVKNHCAD
jgi:ACS family hexuronate transporter-like MFS transporter